MRTIITILIIGLTSCLPKSDENGEIINNIDRLLTEIYPADEPGAVVLVSRKGEVLFRKGYGNADLEMNIANDPDLIYPIGSITKQFTAAGIMLLVEEGVINLDDEIIKFLPELQTFGSKVTVRNLLNHTSGIKSYTNDPEWLLKARLPMSKDEVISIFRDSELEFIPGQKFRYSDSGYFLLGCIIEKVTGLSYFDYLNERFFIPLQMDHTVLGATSPIIKGRASGYKMAANGQYENADFLSLTQPFSAGGLFTTVDDLAKWNHGLFHRQLLSEESLRLIHTANVLVDSTNTHYGFGWEIKDFENHPVISHRGVISGFTSCAGYLPDDDIYVVVVQNSIMGKYFEEDIMQRVMALTLNIPYPGTRFVNLNPDQSESYSGSYQLPDGSMRIVQPNGHGLSAKREGGVWLKLVKNPDGSFYYLHNSNLKVLFEQSGSGNVMAMTLTYSDGTSVRAERIGEQESLKLKE